MNREILFRGKRVDNSEWVYGYYLPWHAVTDLQGNEPYAQIFEEHKVKGKYVAKGWVRVKFNTVGQFTGLTDKNGNKIFEGDIVKVTYTEQRQYQGVSYQDEHSCVEEVIYNEKSACFMLKIMCEDIPLYRPLHNFGSLANIKELEVIGNKWDNPELLEVEQ